MTIDEWKNYGTVMQKEFEDYIKRSDYLDAATYMLSRFGIRPYRESAINPLGKVVNKKESENGITFDIQLIKEKENKPMRQCDIDFEKKKVDLKKEMDQALFDLQMKWEEDKIQIQSEYNQKLLDLEKEKEAAEQKEWSDAHAKAIKDAYDAYIAQGFTKTQAESFVKIVLENQ